MKKILCFGDSNTFGFNPSNGRRYDTNTRWTKLLERLSNNKYKIIEAGCNNRTGFVDNPSGELFTGYKVLPKILSNDLSVIIIGIGINDIQFAYNSSLEDIEQGMDLLINIVRSKLPEIKIVLVSPSVITENILNSYFASMFDETSIQKSKHFAEIYKKLANKYSCEYINLEELVEVSKIDGLHYEPSEHKKIAYAFLSVLNKILG